MQIQDKALLVKLSISTPGNVRKDPKITGEVILQHAMGVKAGRWLKQIYPDEALEPLNRITGETRAWHYLHSLRWTDEGWRILPAAHHFEYTAKLRAFRSQFETTSETHFIAQYDRWIAWGRATHNGSFLESDYPGPAATRSKFGFTVEFQPIPASADFRVHLNADEMDTIKAQVDARVALAVDEARKDLWRRLVEPVRAMVDRLSQKDAVFRDSLIGNIRAIVSLIPALNITADPALEQFRAEIETNLAKWNPATLRDNSAARRMVAARASEILKRMEGYCPNS